jgi:hypothetical protein
MDTAATAAWSVNVAAAQDKKLRRNAAGKSRPRERDWKKRVMARKDGIWMRKWILRMRWMISIRVGILAVGGWTPSRDRGLVWFMGEGGWFVVVLCPQMWVGVWGVRLWLVL